MKLDWQRIILNLHAEGLSFEKISQKCGVDAQRISHLVRGEVYEPKFSTGLALLDLHEKFCTEKHNLDNLKL
jgi:transcriptional regulator with XRE-family HTH domain